MDDLLGVYQWFFYGCTINGSTLDGNAKMEILNTCNRNNWVLNRNEKNTKYFVINSNTEHIDTGLLVPFKTDPTNKLKLLYDYTKSAVAEQEVHDKMKAELAPYNPDIKWIRQQAYTKDALYPIPSTFIYGITNDVFK